MIPHEWRFYCKEGALFPGGPHTWVVIDWDQRSWLQVTGPASALPDEEDGVKSVARYADQLGPGVHAFEISENGDMLGVSLDDDPTWEIRYPKYPEPLDSNAVLHRSELTELDRLHVCTDLVEYNPASHKKELVVFKYSIMRERVENIWDELHILKALAGHTSFVEFHRIVIDEISSAVIGFTSQYVPGGNLEKYDQIFYFGWLEDLSDAVDDLNLQFGIMHQDIAPRNILIDPVTRKPKVFDFDRSALIGSAKQEVGRDDVNGLIFTVYEALTKDQHFRQVPFHEQDVGKVEALDEWELQLPLEDGKGIEIYRNFLREWATDRRTTRFITHYSQATNPISWPSIPELKPLIIEADYGNYESPIRRRKDALKVGDYVTSWERPSQREISGNNTAIE